VILTRSPAIEYLNALTVVPATTSLRDTPTTVWLDESDGMPEACLLNADQIQTVPKTKIRSYVTHLSADKMKEISEALKYALRLDI
jgi:mRNA-degrading endonuclease toxin of MazEF toxin-antitoxin module